MEAGDYINPGGEVPDIDAALAIGVDYIILDGRGGGTGAAPLIFRDHISVPTIPALARARRRAGLHDLERPRLRVVPQVMPWSRVLGWLAGDASDYRQAHEQQRATLCLLEQAGTIGDPVLRQRAGENFADHKSTP